MSGILHAEIRAASVLRASIGAGRAVMNDYVLTVQEVDGGVELTIARGNDVQTVLIRDGAAGSGESGSGEPGTPGQAATVEVGTVTTLPAGSSATVTNSGTSSAAVLNFGIPRGATGAAGAPGPAYTLTDADQTTIVNAVIAALPTYNGGVS